MESRLNYDVVFRYVGSAHVPSDYWPHTFHLVLPVLPKSPPSFELCTSASTAGICSEFPSLLTVVSNFTNGTYYRLNNTIQTINDLLPEMPTDCDLSKQMRSLLPFIGKFSKSLFDTATEEDLDTVANHVNILVKSQSELLNNFKAQSDHLSSFMSLT